MKCETFKVAEDYQIHVELGPHFLIQVPCLATNAGAKFTHPNIARTVAKDLYFKYDNPKRWATKAGVSHFFAVPRKYVKIDTTEKGYSYVKATINGEAVTLNVSGGTGNPGWADFVPLETSTLVNLPMKTLKAIAEVSVRGTDFEPVRTREEIEAEFYAANKGRYMVTTAWGDWQQGVPKGMVGVFACIDGHNAPALTVGKYYLVPKAEYDQREYSFVIDTTRHIEVEDFTKEAVPV